MVLWAWGKWHKPQAAQKEVSTLLDPSHVHDSRGPHHSEHVGVANLVRHRPVLRIGRGRGCGRAGRGEVGHERVAGRCDAKEWRRLNRKAWQLQHGLEGADAPHDLITHVSRSMRTTMPDSLQGMYAQRALPCRPLTEHLTTSHSRYIFASRATATFEAEGGEVFKELYQKPQCENREAAPPLRRKRSC